MSNPNTRMIMEDDDGVVIRGEDHIKAILLEELLRGRESANKLKQLIVNNNGHLQDDDNDDDDYSSPHNHLLSIVISSFSNAISLLNKYPIHPSSSSHHTPKPPPDKRGSYRRKRNMETWRKESEKEREEDGHQWRKYGQKEIQDEKYARNYFRCTHKHGKGCPATKQVQRVQDNPPLYRTTYYGRHTCTNTDTSHILLMQEHHHSNINNNNNNTSSPYNSLFLSFDNSIPNPTTYPIFSPPPEMMLLEGDFNNNLEVVPSSSTQCLDDMMIMDISQFLNLSVSDEEI